MVHSLPVSSGIVSIATGAYHTCAVLTSGVANCWGYNNYGQLGTGDTTNRYSPATVSGLGSGAVAVYRFRCRNEQIY